VAPQLILAVRHVADRPVITAVTVVGVLTAAERRALDRVLRPRRAMDFGPVPDLYLKDSARPQARDLEAQEATEGREGEKDD
jgi:hypothetical protein